MAPTAFGRARAVVLVAVGCALTTGLAHAAVSWFRRAVLHDLLRTWMSPDIAWMSPIGYLLLFVPPALILAALAAAAPRLRVERLAVLLFVTLGAFSFLLLFPRLHQYAALVLAVGIGARIWDFAGRQPERWERRFARAALVGTVLTAGAWGWLTGGRAWGERRAMAALPAAPADAPNVLLLILDTVRASSLSLYGAARPTTPSIARLAAEGVTFDWAFATAPWTLPSHASIFTGRYASQQSGDWTAPLGDDMPTVAEVFSRHGWATGGFTANLIATPRGFGLERGFAHYEDHPRTVGQFVLSTSLGQAESLRLAWERQVEQRWSGGALRALARFDFQPRYSYPDNAAKPAERVVADFLRWQSALGPRPFFAFVNLFDAHGPYASPPAYDTLFGGGDRAVDRYHRAIRYVDDRLGILFDSLRARRVLDRTIIIVTADHGEQFGEHGLAWHSNSLYAQLLHVPLVLRFPVRVPAGRRIGAPASLRDLAATMVDLAGLPDSGGLRGHSLASAWDGAGSAAPVSRSLALSELSRGVNADSTAPHARGSMRALTDDSLNYIRNGNGTFEIYAYRRDPAQEHDLARGPHGALRAVFEARADSALGRIPDPRRP